MGSFVESRGPRGGTLVACINVVLLAALLGVMAAMAVTSSIKPASAHEFSATAVHNGRITYESYTKYTGPRDWAIGQWNPLAGPNYVPRALDTVADLRFSDYSANDGMEGVTIIYSGEKDLIKFNDYYMASNYYADKQAVAVHEAGHALKLAHPQFYESEYWRTRSIMYYCAECSPYNYPQPHDTSDFSIIW